MGFKKLFSNFVDFEETPSPKTTATPIPTPLPFNSTPVSPALNNELISDIKKSIFDQSSQLYKELMNCFEGLSAITSISIIQKYQAAVTTLLNLKKNITPQEIVNAVAERVIILESIKKEMVTDFNKDDQKIQNMVQTIEKTNKEIAALQLQRDELNQKVAVAQQQLQKNKSDFQIACDQISQELTSEHQLIQGIKL